MPRGSLFAVGTLVALSFCQAAQAQQATPASGTWVGLDGRTYEVEPAKPQVDKHGRPRRKVNVGMTVAGGIFAGLGAMAFVGGIAGYFATIDCSSDWFNVRCTDHKEILLVSLGGAVSAAAIGTPLLVVGLRRPAKKEIEKPAEEASVSLTLGAVSGFRVSF